MPIISWETPDYALFVVSGQPDHLEVIDALEAYYRVHSTKHALWDFSDASMSAVSAEHFADIAIASAKFATVRGPGARTAKVVASDSELLLVKAFAAAAKDTTPVAFSAFSDIGSARAWLGD